MSFATFYLEQIVYRKTSPHLEYLKQLRDKKKAESEANKKRKKKKS